MLKDLENAREFIFMEYFAVEDTEVFHRIEEILLKKYRRVWKYDSYMTTSEASAL